MSSSYRNVFGESLSSCSQDGMALTGFTRTGYCVDRNDDQGSHHICIDLSSAAGGNFCEVTGQSDWCSSEDMPCHEDIEESCAIQHWCVCQWAFASYLANAGGCDSIQDIVCDSINLEAVLAYVRESSSKKYANALTCLESRCQLNLTNSELYGTKAAPISGSIISSLVLFIVGVIVVGAGVVWKRAHRGRVNNKDVVNSSTKLI